MTALAGCLCTATKSMHTRPWPGYAHAASLYLHTYLLCIHISCLLHTSRLFQPLKRLQYPASRLHCPWKVAMPCLKVALPFAHSSYIYIYMSNRKCMQYCTTFCCASTFALESSCIEHSSSTTQVRLNKKAHDHCTHREATSHNHSQQAQFIVG